MTRKHAISLAASCAKLRGIIYAVSEHNGKYILITLYSAQFNGLKIIYRTDKS